MNQHEFEVKVKEINENYDALGGIGQDLYMLRKLAKLLFRLIITFPVAIIVLIICASLQSKYEKIDAKVIELTREVIRELVLNSNTKDLLEIFNFIPETYAQKQLDWLLENDSNFSIFQKDKTGTLLIEKEMQESQSESVIVIDETKNDLTVNYEKSDNAEIQNLTEQQTDNLDFNQEELSENKDQEKINENREQEEINEDKDKKFEEIYRTYKNNKVRYFDSFGSLNIKKVIATHKDYENSIDDLFLYCIIDENLLEFDQLQYCMNEWEACLYNKYGMMFKWKDGNTNKKLTKLITDGRLNGYTIDRSNRRLIKE